MRDILFGRSAAPYVALSCIAMTSVGGCARASSDSIDVTPIATTAPAGAKGALTAAHDAYLKGDFVALGERVRDVLLDPASAARVKENAFQLLDKAYEVQGGALPSSFDPPRSIQHLQYLYRRTVAPNGTKYLFRFAGSMRDASHLVGVTVRRLPDETLMDKASGKGKFALRHDPARMSLGLEEFVIDSETTDSLPADGVISLRLELDDGTVSEGFIITHDLAPDAMASPEILSPTSSAWLSDPNPTISWSPFRSRQYQPFEVQSTVIHVSREGGGPSVWEFSSRKGDTSNEARIGSVGSPNTALAPGDYRLLLSAGETRSFGPVQLIRSSATVQSFHVLAADAPSR